MRGLAKDTIVLAKYAYEVLNEIQPATLRQTHYSVFSRDEIDYENNLASYRKLSAVTSMSRRLHRLDELGETSYEQAKLIVSLESKLIPHSWIVDETRQPHMVTVWDDIAEYIDCVKSSYRRDNWATQPWHVEVWSEKGTVLGSLRPIADELGITIRVCKGFASAGMEGEIGDLFSDLDKRIIVFYLGDHDPSGHEIEKDIHTRAQTAAGKPFDMMRLAIHAEDIERYKLPPQKIKLTDSRARGFKRQFGRHAKTVELDALPVDVLRQRVRKHIKSFIDRDLWDQQLSTEQAEFECIQRFADTVKNLPQMEKPEA